MQSPRRHRPSPPLGSGTPDARTGDRIRALERAAHLAVLAPSVHDTQPWRLELHSDRLVLRAAHSRPLTKVDPTGRELVQSVGAALFNARVALAADGWAADVERLPDPGDLDLLAVVRPVPGAPDTPLADLAAAVPRRRTNRRASATGELPDEELRGLTESAAAEEVVLVPVLSESHRRLVARLTRQAENLQNAEPAYRAELRCRTSRHPRDHDGVPPASVPYVDGRSHGDLPLRYFDTIGARAWPTATSPCIEQTIVLLATRSDDQWAWLRCGEAMQRVLLELTRLGWAASPLTQAVEVPVTRIQLRSALIWDAHPQLLLRVGRADSTPPTPRRSAEEIIVGRTGPQQPRRR